MSNPTQFKVPPREVPSDDCPLVVGRRIEDDKITDPGQTYYPHVGEAVSILPTKTLQGLLKLRKLGFSTDDEDPAEKLGRLDRSLADICEHLAGVIVGWDWTDLGGEPLPQPYKRPEVLAELETDELVWLIQAAQGETKSERKNGSAPLPSGSTARGQRRRKS